MTSTSLGDSIVGVRTEHLVFMYLSFLFVEVNAIGYFLSVNVFPFLFMFLIVFILSICCVWFVSFVFLIHSFLSVSPLPKKWRALTIS